MSKRRASTRFRLVIYERMWRSWKWPCLLLLLASLLLFFCAPRLLIPPTLRPLILIPILGTSLLMLYAHLARKTAWVQCRPDALHVQTPIYPLTISYRRIKGVRPMSVPQFIETIKGQKAAKRARKWLRPYLTKTAIVIDLSQYPVQRGWLRLWFHPYLFYPDSPGFVFLVEDWMTLSRQIDDSRANWEMRRIAQRRKERAEPSWR